MQTRSSDENAVRLSVRPSVTRVDCDKTVERSVQIDALYKSTFTIPYHTIYHTKDHLASFSEKKNGWWGGDPFYLKFWVNWPPLERNRQFSTDIARSSSAVTPAKKVQLALTGSPLRAFQ